MTFKDWFSCMKINTLFFLLLLGMSSCAFAQKQYGKLAEVRQSERQISDIVNGVFEELSADSLMLSIPNYDYELNVAQLYEKSIERLVDPSFVINQYLSEKEIEFLTSEQELSLLKQQKKRYLTWSKFLGPESKLPIKQKAGSIDSYLNKVTLSIGYPLIFSNGQFALVYIEIKNSYEDAGGVVFLMKLTKKRWAKVVSFEQWVS